MVRSRRGFEPSCSTTDAERPVVAARVAGLDDVDVINAEDVPEALDISDVERVPAAAAAADPDVWKSNWRCWPFGWR